MYGHTQAQHGAAVGYGAAAPAYVDEQGLGKGAFVRTQRRRLNLNAIVLAVAGPWLLFCAVGAALSFEVRHEQPLFAWAIVVACFSLVALTGLCGCTAAGRWLAGAEREPTWFAFLFVSLVVAFCSATVLGSSIYKASMLPYYDMRSLNNYSNVIPSKVHGQQLMDGGIVEFAIGSKLDISRSIGFKSGKVYCVAPVVLGDDKPETYDFWAVGVDCCSGSHADFSCANYNDPVARGGLRLMSEGDRPFYRLAVQQAEAAYKIKASFPVFFEWTVDPSAKVEQWKRDGRSRFITWMLSFLVYQSFLVTSASLAFAKMGSS